MLTTWVKFMQSEFFYELKWTLNELWMNFASKSNVFFYIFFEKLCKEYLIKFTDINNADASYLNKWNIILKFFNGKKSLMNWYKGNKHT